MSSRYTTKQWRTERSALNRGDPPSKCPRCNRTGFYAPREDHPEKPRKPYRSCSFCGLWQDVGGDEERATKYECHGHLETNAPGATWQCPSCGTEKKPDAGKPWPVDDPKHRWWFVPQDLSQDEYITYWRMDWGHDAKPHGII